MTQTEINRIIKIVEKFNADLDAYAAVSGDYELPEIDSTIIGYSAHLIRKYKKHWWNKWQIEMDGATPKIYLVDQEHCVHDYKFIDIVYTVSYPAGIPMRCLRCTKCGH